MAKETLTIRASDSLKGELVLPSVAGVFKAGRERPISEETYWSDDVQRAIAQGLIEISSGQPRDKDLMEGRVTIASMHPKRLILPSLPVDFTRQGQDYTISRKVFQNQDIQQALAYGLICVIHEGANLSLENQTKAKKKTTKKATAPTASKKSKSKKPSKKSKKDADNSVDALLKYTEASESEDDENIEMLDDADVFKETGQASIVKREAAVPNTYKPYDPRGEADRRNQIEPKAKAEGKKRGIKPVGRAKKSGSLDAGDNDGIDITMLT